ncbi:MAG TPA: 23S rRNA (pseudouridine(1915)-N(3))-methyltransferase RlmH [Methylothermaceae bacterium]|nr:23S rRNA (pseudouridine(1915)-N(3))-methyltransferase RlmH [Methylothermaceae bacterium]
MQVRLIAVGTRMPSWVEVGYTEYAKRLPKEWRLQLREIPLRRRGKGTDRERLMAEEGKQMLTALGNARGIALDSRGLQWSTEELADQLSTWLQEGRDLGFLIGGPEGLAPECLQRAEIHWSLSRLTFPHALVRILVVEQLYRAWTLLQGHPYHR